MEKNSIISQQLTHPIGSFDASTHQLLLNYISVIK